jgi:hypothetical protein
MEPSLRNPRCGPPSGAAVSDPAARRQQHAASSRWSAAHLLLQVLLELLAVLLDGRQQLLHVLERLVLVDGVLRGGAGWQQGERASGVQERSTV